MGFPYSIRNNIILSAEDYELTEIPPNAEEILRRTLINRGYVYENGLFLGRNALFSIPYKFDVQVEETKEGLSIKYNIIFQEFVNGLLIINLLIAFFSKFKFEFFLWFVLLVDVILYLLNFIIVKNGLTATILKMFSEYKKYKILDL